jgi:hypothetical protein
MKPTDLTLDRPEQWAEGRSVDESFCRRLTERAVEVNEHHGMPPDVNCYKKISWFLQHCTDYRYQLKRSWDIAKMFADLSPIMDEFIASVEPPGVEVAKVTSLGDGHSTATITKTDPMF